MHVSDPRDIFFPIAAEESREDGDLTYFSFSKSFRAAASSFFFASSTFG